MTSVSAWAELLLETAVDVDWLEVPARAVIGDPTIDWSDCCSGLVAVELRDFGFAGAAWPSTGVYQPTPFNGDCADEVWAARFAVIVVRCVPTFDAAGGGESGLPASAEEVRESADRLFTDVTAVWRRLRERSAVWFGTHGSAVVGGWSPLPRQGSCGGWEIDVTVKVVDCG